MLGGQKAKRLGGWEARMLRSKLTKCYKRISKADGSFGLLILKPYSDITFPPPSFQAFQLLDLPASQLFSLLHRTNRPVSVHTSFLTKSHP